MAVAAMANAAADIIKQVRAKAAVSGDSIYTLASIPIPATPSPKGPPGPPTALIVTLDGDGTLHLKWKCVNPAGATGTIYQVWRRDGADGEFAYLGGTGVKAFDDSTVPAGVTRVTYQIQAVRSTVQGPWSQFNVNFGAGGGGSAMMIASVEQTPPTPRVAA
jgi:hypothetical protein